MSSDERLMAVPKSDIEMLSSTYPELNLISTVGSSLSSFSPIAPILGISVKIILLKIIIRQKLIQHRQKLQLILNQMN